MKGGLVVGVAMVAVAAAPLGASTYHVLLMLPFMAYAVVLLGLNLLFGYAGLVSFGHALFIAQLGRKHEDAKPLRGYGGAGVLELVEDFDGDTYRAVYTVKFTDAVYVLHVFQ